MCGGTKTRYFCRTTALTHLDYVLEFHCLAAALKNLTISRACRKVIWKEEGSLFKCPACAPWSDRTACNLIAKISEQWEDDWDSQERGIEYDVSGNTTYIAPVVTQALEAATRFRKFHTSEQPFLSAPTLTATESARRQPLGEIAGDETNSHVLPPIRQQLPNVESAETGHLQPQAGDDSVVPEPVEPPDTPSNCDEWRTTSGLTAEEVLREQDKNAYEMLKRRDTRRVERYGESHYRNSTFICEGSSGQQNA